MTAEALDPLVGAVHVHVDGAVWAECGPCGLYLELVDDAPLAAARAAFLAQHGAPDLDGHSPAAPAGWRRPLARWCALSQ